MTEAAQAATLAVILFAVWIGISWFFYMTGAWIAEWKGRSRALGWWLVFFFPLAPLVFLVLLMLPNVDTQYIPAKRPEARHVADQLDRLARLRDGGALTDQEFEERKRALLSQR